MAEYRIDRLSEENLYYLQVLYQASFNLIVKKEFLIKKYDTRLFGASFIGYIAFVSNTNEVAGYYGVFPILGEIHGKRVLVAQSGDTMTHPKHQGKGLFTKLAKATYDLAEKEGISFVFGFPNNNSYPGFINKLNWTHYSDVNNYIIKTGALPFDKLAKKLDIFNFVYKIWLSKKLGIYASEIHMENSIKFQNPGAGMVVHDEKFYKYKEYYKHHVIKLDEIVCVLKVDGRMWIGDISYCTVDKFFQTVENLKKLARKVGCSALQFSFFKGSYFDNLLKEKYEISSRNAVGYINLKKDFDPEEFAYQGFDFDTY